MTFPFSLDERKMIVRVREAQRYADRVRPVSSWTRRTLDAIHADRQSEDFRNDPDAR